MKKMVHMSFSPALLMMQYPSELVLGLILIQMSKLNSMDRLKKFLFFYQPKESGSLIFYGFFEESSCKWENVKGTCVEPRRCLSTTELRKEKEHPVCGQKGDLALICCTDCELVNDTSNAVVNPAGGLLWKDGRKFRDHCLQYLKDLPNVCAQQGYYGSVSKNYNEEKKCHAASVWGVGGAPPPEAEHPRENPYEALMGFGKDLDSAIWMTSGAIISEKFILTSASVHTTTGGKIPLKFAAFGVHNRSSDKKEWQIRTVKEIHHHPLYIIETNYNDLALLELDSEITFNKDVLPACLPDPEATIDTRTAKYSNWKKADMKFEEFADVAEIVEVPELTAQECDVKLTKVLVPSYSSSVQVLLTPGNKRHYSTLLRKERC